MKRNYSERWTEEETFRLINGRIKLEENFKRKVVDIRSCWESVGVEAELPNVPWERLRKKWRNLVNKYKQIKEPPTGAGSGDGEMAIKWPFFAILNKYCADKHFVNPPILIDSESPFITMSVSSPEELPSTSNGSRRRQHPSPTELEKDELKTNKKIRKASSAFLEFMSKKFGIEVDSSESE